MLPITLLLLGITLRIFALGNYPPGLFRDEAALGYNGYSIWLTGRDEYGVFLPKVFRSFEVFFLPLYVYIVAPLVGLLGLSELTTRLPSALSGIFLLVVIYFVAKEIWDKKTALFSLFVLVVSPWHIFYSRGAFEGNLALTLFSAGILFWLKFTKKEESRPLFLSAAFFVLSMYAYQSERVLVPLLGLVAVLIFRKKIFNSTKKIILVALVSSILLLPLLSISSKAGGYHRSLGVSIFSQQKTPPGWIEEERAGLVINNRIYLLGRQISALYLSYLSPKNLFIEGDYDKQRSVGNYSVFYAWMFPFLVLGFFKIAKKPKAAEKLILSAIVLSPIPSALTADPFHTYRSLPLYLFLSLLVGLGLAWGWELIKRRRVFLVAGSFVAIISTVGFLFSYFVINQVAHALAWDYGYKEVVSFVNEVSMRDSSSKVVVDDIWTEPYIHFLFFGTVDPRIYQKEVLGLQLAEDFYYADPNELRPNKFKNYEFRKVDWPGERGDRGTIFVISANRLPRSEFETDPKIELLKETVYPSGEVAFRIVRVK